MKRWKWFVLMATLAIANCGGGGGGDSPPPAPTTPLTWDAAGGTWDNVIWQ